MAAVMHELGDTTVGDTTVDSAAHDEAGSPSPVMREVLAADALVSALAVHVADLHAAHARYLELLLAVVDGHAWDAGATVRTIGQWASVVLGLDARTVERDVATARALTHLPALRASLAAGRVSLAKVTAVCTVATPATEHIWVNLAEQGSCTQVQRVTAQTRRIQRELDRQDGEDTEGSAEDDEAARAHARRGVWWSDGPDGLVRLTALLHPDDAAALRAAIERTLEHHHRRRTRRRATRPDDASSPAGPSARGQHRADDGDVVAPEEPDCRPPTPHEPVAQEPAGHEPGQPAEPEPGDDVPLVDDPADEPWERAAARRADALAELARAAFHHAPAASRDGEPIQALLRIDHALLDGSRDTGTCALDGHAVPVGLARMLTCDAIIRPVLLDPGGTPTTIGCPHRTIPRHLRRLVRERDGGCVVPGCGSTRHLDVHHIVHWANGGPTTLDNLVLLCRRHHRAHHHGAFTLQRRPDGSLVFADRHGRPLDHPSSGRSSPARLTHRHRSTGFNPEPDAPLAKDWQPYWSPLDFHAGYPYESG